MIPEPEPFAEIVFHDHARDRASLRFPTIGLDVLRGEIRAAILLGRIEWRGGARYELWTWDRVRRLVVDVDGRGRLVVVTVSMKETGTLREEDPCRHLRRGLVRI